jgi:hypothetical protein
MLLNNAFVGVYALGNYKVNVGFLPAPTGTLRDSQAARLILRSKVHGSYAFAKRFVNLCNGDPRMNPVCRFCTAWIPEPHSDLSVFRRYLFVGDGRARCDCEMNNVKALEACFAAPFTEIRPRIVECVTELNKHVQRH